MEKNDEGSVVQSKLGVVPDGFVEVREADFGTPWHPVNPGDFVEGVYLRSDQGVGKHRKNVYYLENKLSQGDSLRSVWGSAGLDPKMVNVPVGSFIRIEYLGEKDVNKGNPLKLFKVYQQKKS